MLIEKDKGCVATWWFESVLPVPTLSRESLHEMLVMCQTVVEILAAHELLRPSKVVLSKWMKPGSDELKLIADEPHYELSLNPSSGSAEFIDACERALTELQSRRGFLYPNHIEITGTGVIFDAAGNRCEQADVCWVWGATLGHHIVYVKTQSDAWLPYTLRAEPQPEVWKHNAPRLEAALREMEAAFGVAPAYEPQTPCALVHEYTLSNHTYSDGEVVEVI